MAAPPAVPGFARPDFQRAAELPSEARAGILGLRCLLTKDGVGWLGLDSATPPSGVEIIEAAIFRGARQLWLGPSTLKWLGLPKTFTVPPARQADRYRYGLRHPWLDPIVAAGWIPSTLPPGLNPWLGLAGSALTPIRDPAPWIDLVIPSWDSDNPFGAARSAGELLDALQQFSGQLGLRYRRSPGATGLALMRMVHAGPRALPLPEPHLAPPAVDGLDSETSDAWVSDRKAKGWLHAWDLNGMYLAACSSAELGFGKPYHIDRPGPPAGAGYWRAAVKIAAARAYPLPFKADGEPHWYSAPSLILARERGAELELGEAWVYPERHRWLEPWYARLRDARAHLLAQSTPGAALALFAVKATYTRSLGRLAGRWLEIGDETFRPDWRDVVISRARANLHRHLARIETATGRTPWALSADTVIYACPELDPLAAAQALGLELGSQLGKWKHAGRLEALNALQGTSKGDSPSSRLRAVLGRLERA